MIKMTNKTNVPIDRAGRDHSDARPPIVLTASDRDRLCALLCTAATAMGSLTARFLRKEIERADIAPDDVASTSVVRMGSEVKFIDHGGERIHRAKLVFPEEARNSQCISVLSSVGSALIGLGPGQSIRWTDQDAQRSLAVLEVHTSECKSSHSHRGQA
jgi:regulator of nucleoside diphosphate kinase